jgi:hypothetical protein
MLTGVAKVSDQAGLYIRSALPRNFSALLNPKNLNPYPRLRLWILHIFAINVLLPPWRCVAFVGGADAVMA